jgi:uncharacterized protein (TIGR02246 family)
VAPVDAIVEMLVSLEQTWNESDAAALARFFTSDAIFITQSGNVWQGRPAIEEGHAAGFSGPLIGTMLSLRPINIAYLTTSIAVVQVHIALATDTSTARAIGTFVFVSDGGRWAIAAAHTSDVASIH